MQYRILAAAAAGLHRTPGGRGRRDGSERVLIGYAGVPVENAKENEYRKQAQITELNAMNAIMAVIRFKQHFRLLDRLDEATSYIFETATMKME